MTRHDAAATTGIYVESRTGRASAAGNLIRFCNTQQSLSFVLPFLFRVHFRPGLSTRWSTSTEPNCRPAANYGAVVLSNSLFPQYMLYSATTSTLNPTAGQQQAMWYICPISWGSFINIHCTVPISSITCSTLLQQQSVLDTFDVQVTDLTIYMVWTCSVQKRSAQQKG